MKVEALFVFSVLMSAHEVLHGRPVCPHSRGRRPVDAMLVVVLSS
jgi:hypothetical protein